MANLDSQRKQVQIVINFPINAPMEDLENFLSSIGSHYAYIVHDKDINDNGEFKTRHIHLVIDSLKKHRLKVFLGYVCDALNVNENQVSILPCESLEYAIQYLIHKNDANKYQYDVNKIHSNYNEGVLYDYLNADVMAKLTTQNIIDIVVESRGNRIRIIEALGINRYLLYRNVINDVYKSLGYLVDKY